jgi:hypothetical protein
MRRTRPCNIASISDNVCSVRIRRDVIRNQCCARGRRLLDGGLPEVEVEGGLR